MHLRALQSTCLAVVVAMAIGGCGGSDPSPAALVASSRQAAAQYRTVLASGVVPSTGNLYIRVDLHIARGKGAVGYITYRPNNHEAFPLDVVLIGETIYLKGHQDFFEWIGDTRAAPHLAEKWIRASVNSKSMFRALRSYAELSNLLRGFYDAPGKLSLGRATGVVGTKVIEVENDATEEVLYVATAGKPYPTQILKSGESTVEGITFDHWNWPVPLTPPAKAIDLEG